jgi:hypothetical protein
MGRIGQFTAICVAASLVVASTDICAATQPASTAEILAIQSLVADILGPAPSSDSPSSTSAFSVLDVQRLLSGLSESDEGQPSTAMSDWWALSPAPLRGTSLEATPIARLIEVPRASASIESSAGALSDDAYTARAAPVLATWNQQTRLNNPSTSTWRNHHEID